MTPRIAIPVPTSTDVEYNRLNWTAYADAVRDCGGTPVEIPLDQASGALAQLAGSCQAVLLPGSPADVSPAKYGQPVGEASTPADLPREETDQFLLEDAHQQCKPLLAICFGMQMLNVWRAGTLIQDLNIMPVNHAAGRAVAVAHSVSISPASLLASLVDAAEAPAMNGNLRLPVNSSHHQAVGIPGQGLMVTSRCPHDGVIESLEPVYSAESKPHFVLAVQWHPERTVAVSPTSRAMFSRFVREAALWTPRPVPAAGRG